VLFGNPETTSGGNALKFYASMRLDIRAREKITETGKVEPIGNRVKVKVVKNKVCWLAVVEATYKV
jgi:recombination protein RecA